MINPSLLQLDQELAGFDAKLRLVAHLRPHNLQEERRKFFASETHEPQFLYAPIPEKVGESAAALRLMTIPLDHPLGRLLEEKRRELLAKSALILAIGRDELFPAQAEKHFGFPPEQVIRMAAMNLGKRKKRHPAGKRYSADEAVEYLQAALKARGLGHWTIEKKRGLVSRCVVARRRKVLLRTGEKFSQKALEKLIAHEIEIHLYCLENAALQPYRIFQHGTARSLRTQEGLAIYHQQQKFGAAAPSGVLGFHAALFARENGFRAVYDELRNFVSPLKAWKMTSRVKRGMSNTALPGSLLKNILYFWGYTEVCDYLQHGGDFRKLFLGNCAVDQLGMIADLKELAAPRYIPQLTSPDFALDSF